MEEKELEDQLVEAGNKLLDSPPSAVDELLPLLNQVENCLLRVEQSPSKSMLAALHPSVKALVTKELLRHSDTDVKVAVASCISEITRITAPDAPYDDDLMKEIFQMIVTAFEKLHDMSSASYSKRVSILETVAKVRSCVVMLDLECDTLILEMFHHFLKAIREKHPDNVFSSMETIMTLVLEESEDISSELLSCLLISIRNDNEDVLPIARRLGEKVIGNCAAKLKPYLMQEVQAARIVLDDYSKIVSSICQERNDGPENNVSDAPGEQLGDQRKGKSDSEVMPQGHEKLDPETCPGEVEPMVSKSSTAMMSNGTVQAADGDSLVEAESQEKKLEHSHKGSQLKITVSTTKNDTDHPEPSKSQSGPDPATKKARVWKTNLSTLSTETSDDSLIDSEKVAVDLPKRKKGRSKEANKSISEGPSTKEASMPLKNAEKPEPTLQNVVSASPTHSFPDSTRPKRGRPMAKKKGGANAEADQSNLPPERKETVLTDQTADEALQSANLMSKKELEGNSDSEVKALKYSGKKGNARNATEDETLPSVDAESKKDAGGVSDSEEKPLKRFSKKVRQGNTAGSESSVKQQGDKIKRRKGTPGAEKSEAGESSQKKLLSSPKHGRNDQETPKMKNKRGRVPPTEKVAEDLGENLVGSRIKVWWPDDDEYYPGTVSSYDPESKRHQISYDDGDKETLLLRDEKWVSIDRDMALDGGQATDIGSPEASEMPRSKKAKASSDTSTRQGKTDASLKKTGASASKSKEDGPKKGNKSRGSAAKSGGKSKGDEGKVGGKLEERTSKMSGKSKGDTPKASSQSKDDMITKARDETPKTDRKSKDDLPKTGTKSKDGTPKMGSKSKDGTLKTGTKSKDGTPKTSTKSKDETPKMGTKLKDEAPKMGTKAKDEAPKTSTKSKDVSPKTGAGKSKEDADKAGVKSKGTTPQTSKSNANGASVKGKSVTSKAKENKESEDVPKGKSGALVKEPENESKSGKKRRRGGP